MPNANLSSGGTACNCTDNLHPKWQKLAIKITQEMGLRFCGVDVIIAGTLDDTPGDYVVLEINAAPGIGNFVTLGKKEEKIAKKIYERLFLTIIK